MVEDKERISTMRKVTSPPWNYKISQDQYPLMHWQHPNRIYFVLRTWCNYLARMRVKQVGSCSFLTAIRSRQHYLKLAGGAPAVNFRLLLDDSNAVYVKQKVNNCQLIWRKFYDQIFFIQPSWDEDFSGGLDLLKIFRNALERIFSKFFVFNPCKTLISR